MLKGAFGVSFFLLYYVSWQHPLYKNCGETIGTVQLHRNYITSFGWSFGCRFPLRHHWMFQNKEESHNAKTADRTQMSAIEAGQYAEDEKLPRGGIFLEVSNCWKTG